MAEQQQPALQVGSCPYTMPRGGIDHHCGSNSCQWWIDEEMDCSHRVTARLLSDLVHATQVISVAVEGLTAALAQLVGPVVTNQLEQAVGEATKAGASRRGKQGGGGDVGG